MKKILHLLVVVLLLCPTSVSTSISASEYNQAALGITLQVDFGNGTLRTFNDLSSDTVLNLTESVLPVEYEWEGNLVFVTAIDGVSQSSQEGKWWQYWINGEYGSIAANKYILDDYDTVEWKLVSYNAPTTDSTDPSLLVGIVVIGAIGVGFLLIISRRYKE
ncbi:MAG: DUF4430 domain-containing protein [Candidatus Lokiarchaeota archaeon]|nr:DUF4430 domain-containing protein [Candidatus Lokiarchaeota archaeon]